VFSLLKYILKFINFKSNKFFIKKEYFIFIYYLNISFFIIIWLFKKVIIIIPKEWIWSFRFWASICTSKESKIIISKSWWSGSCCSCSRWIWWL